MCTKVNVPECFMGRTGYQVFVDRFCRVGSLPPLMKGRVLKHWEDATPDWWPDGDGEYRNQYFYGGNLKGIISKLSYFENMGINLLYLSPISYTKSSHHYDVEDQRVIDPWIGSWQDFIELCEKAHEKKILICVDMVFNHMGSNSPFFQEAVRSKNSKYHEWFEWDQQGNPVYWYGFKDMPQCDKLNPSYQKYACDVCKFYLKMGADGIRMDLGENLPKEFMQKIRECVKSFNPNALIVNEMWEFATHKEDPQIFGGQADSVMNYPMSDAICRWVRYGNAAHFLYTWEELSKYPEDVKNVLWNFLGSHDIPRPMNMLMAEGMNQNPFSGRIWDIEAPWRRPDSFDTFGFRKWEANNDCNFDMVIARKRIMLASLLQYFVPGVPIVYYGTEVDITGYKDPFNRKPYPWGKFSELFEYYCEIGRFRKKYMDMFANSFISELKVNDSTLLMVRENRAGALYLVMNRTDVVQKNPIRDWDTDNWKVVYEVQGGTKQELQPYSAIVYTK